MKKIFTILILLILGLGLSACGGDDMMDDTMDESLEAPEEEAVPETAEEAVVEVDTVDEEDDVDLGDLI